MFTQSWNLDLSADENETVKLSPDRSGNVFLGANSENAEAVYKFDQSDGDPVETWKYEELPSDTGGVRGLVVDQHGNCYAGTWNNTEYHKITEDGNGNPTKEWDITLSNESGCSKAALHPDGDKIVIAGNDRVHLIEDIHESSPTEVWTYDPGHASNLRNVSYDANGAMIVCSRSSGTDLIRLVDDNGSPDETWSVDVDSSGLFGTTIPETGSLFLGSDSGAVYKYTYTDTGATEQWSLDESSEYCHQVTSWPGATDEVFACFYNPDNRVVRIVDDGNDANPSVTDTFTGHTDNVREVKTHHEDIGTFPEEYGL